MMVIMVIIEFFLMFVAKERSNFQRDYQGHFTISYMHAVLLSWCDEGCTGLLGRLHGANFDYPVHLYN